MNEEELDKYIVQKVREFAEKHKNLYYFADYSRISYEAAELLEELCNSINEPE